MRPAATAFLLVAITALIGGRIGYWTREDTVLLLALGYAALALGLAWLAVWTPLPKPPEEPPEEPPEPKPEPAEDAGKGFETWA
jgi:hypothetical protein